MEEEYTHVDTRRRVLRLGDFLPDAMAVPALKKSRRGEAFLW